MVGIRARGRGERARRARGQGWSLVPEPMARVCSARVKPKMRGVSADWSVQGTEAWPAGLQFDL